MQEEVNMMFKMIEMSPQELEDIEDQVYFIVVAADLVQ